MDLAARPHEHVRARLVPVARVLLAAGMFGVGVDTCSMAPAAQGPPPQEVGACRAEIQAFGAIMASRQVATVSVPGCLAVVSPRAPDTQLRQRPYDVALVRAAAAAIQREVTTPSRQEEALAGPLQFIVESLSGLSDFKDVPDEVVDAVAVLAGSGRMASDTLIRFADRAVTALIRSARTSSPRPPYPGGAMDVLQEMLLRRTAEHTLSEGSRAAVRAMVRELLGDKRLGSVELAALGCLAVATADPELRAAAERLTEASTLTSRGVPTEAQAYVIARIRRALDTIPKRIADEPRR